MKYSEVETPQEFIEDMCGDWDWRSPVEEKVEHLEGYTGSCASIE